MALLIPEYLRLGVWDLITGWNQSKNIFSGNLALQMINESALCLNGIRASRSLNHQGFEVLNGLSFIASDKTVHEVLDKTTVAETKAIQIALGKIRKQLGDYKSRIYILDPHSIVTHSRCITPKKMISKESKPKKVLETYFCLEAETGQPVGFIISSSGRTVSNATEELIDILLEINPEGGLLIADAEHSTARIMERIRRENNLECLVPASRTKKVESYYEKIDYVESKDMWTGYSIGSIPYQLGEMEEQILLIVQKIRSSAEGYSYKPFYSTEKSSAEGYKKLVTETFRKRWTIEEFFNFESALGWNRASTMNLNIRYGKLTMGLIAQAAIYRLRQKMPKPYRQWTAEHLAEEIFLSTDGNIRVKGDTIIVTFYNFPKELDLEKYYKNLPEKLESEGIDPKIPWLFNYKLDFRFK